jgi:hypothetical protein
MGSGALRRVLRRSIGLAVLALACSPVAATGLVYHYTVTSATYTAKGELAGGHFTQQCVGISFWEGHMTSAGQPGSAVGVAVLKIHGHGTSGEVDADIDLKSQLGNSFFRETTSCDESDTENGFVLLPCAKSIDSRVHVAALIRGGVGTHVRLYWEFDQHEEDGALMPDSSCDEPFDFPYKKGACKSQATLFQLNRKHVTLPFRCFFTTTTPAPGSKATKLSASAFNTGALHLTRHP